jgi:cyclic pyranopterin phosphate synthase
MLAGVEGIEDLSLTTNGTLLQAKARALKEAGLSRLTVSLDTLKPHVYERITRGGQLARALAGLDEALQVGLVQVKLNVVVIRGLNDDELLNFVNFASSRGIEVRFIELMPLGRTKLIGRHFFISAREMRVRLEKEIKLIPAISRNGCGPAEVYELVGWPGRVGFITPVSSPFCARCNRLRLSANGLLHTCLFGGPKIDLKPCLKPAAGEEALKRLLCEAVALKPQGRRGFRQIEMSRVGG